MKISQQMALKFRDDAYQLVDELEEMESNGECELEQNWDEELTIAYFADDSRLMISGPVISVYS